MKLAPAVLLLALLPACLENEEQITVRADGSCSVRILAKGQAQDFAEGYPIPTGREWRVVSADVPNYPGWLLSGVGTEELRGRLPQQKDKPIAFELAGEFSSLAALPKYFAPAREPYRAAYLERTSELRIEPRGSKTLYTFERRFGAREFARFDNWSRMKRALPPDLARRMERAGQEKLVLAPGEFPRIAQESARAMQAAALAHLEDALLADYTLGDASLPAAATEQVRSTVAAALAGVILVPRVRAILDLVFTPAAEPQAAAQPNGAEAGARLATLESETREALRKSTREALAGVRANPGVSNAILAQLESSLTAFDHTNDLGDEVFRLRLSLPGATVGGNYDKLEQGVACWEFKGSQLQDREVVLRAVSVVE